MNTQASPSTSAGCGSRIASALGAPEIARVTPFQHRIGAVVAELQPGEVVSYQEVARRAGSSRASRAVGAFLAEFGDGLPWWRVVHKRGALSARTRSRQRARLSEEGVDVVSDQVMAPVA